MTEMKHLTQEKITILMNHINNTSRKGLNNTTPYKLAQLLVDKKVFETFSFKEIHPNNVHLRKELLDPGFVKITLLNKKTATSVAVQWVLKTP